MTCKSLLILCASFVMAASVSVSDLVEYQAQDQSLNLVIVCEKPVKLLVAFIEKSGEEITAAFIEDHKICTTHRFDDGPGIKVRGVADNGGNWGSLDDRFENHYDRLTCKWFYVFMPKFGDEDTPFVKCLE